MSLNSCPEIRLTAQPRSVRRPHQLCSLGARGTLEDSCSNLQGTAKLILLLLAAIAVVGAWFALRWIGVGARIAGRGNPCPVLLAALFDNRTAQRLGGSALLIERAGVTEKMRVLDAGCGPGRVTIPLARRVGPAGEVVALDLQQGMLDRVNANAARAGLTNIHTVVGALELDAAALRGYEEAFDRVILVTVLGEIPDQAGGLRSLHRTLKAGGMLSVTEMIIDPDYVSSDRVQRLAEGAGFRFVQSYGSPIMLTANFIKPNIVGDLDTDLNRERSPC